MTWRRVIVAGLLAGILGTNVSAQTEEDLGSRIRIPRRARIADHVGMSPADRGRLSMAEFARCVVARGSQRLPSILNTPAEKLDGEAVAKLATSECLNDGQMSFKPLLFRGALFNELYRRRELKQVGVRMPTAVAYDAGEVAKAKDADATQIALLDFAACVVDAAPAASSAFVLADPVSKQETVTLATLHPALGPCLPQGEQVTLSRIVVKGALAELLYRGTVKPVPTASQEAK